MLSCLGHQGFLLESSYNLAVWDPSTQCIWAPRTSINNILASLWALVLPRIPGILRSWSLSFEFFYLGGSLGHGYPFLLLLPRRCSWCPWHGTLIIWFQFVIKHCFYKIHFSLAERVRVGKDSYGLPIQSPFNTLMVHGGNEAMLIELGVSQQNMLRNF